MALRTRGKREAAAAAMQDGELLRAQVDGTAAAVGVPQINGRTTLAEQVRRVATRRRTRKTRKRRATGARKTRINGARTMIVLVMVTIGAEMPSTTVAARTMAGAVVLAAIYSMPVAEATRLKVVRVVAAAQKPQGKVIGPREGTMLEVEAAGEEAMERTMVPRAGVNRATSQPATRMGPATILGPFQLLMVA